MTDDITAKALALVNALGSEPTGIQATKLNRNDIFHEALYRAIEQHETYKQKVSDAAEEYKADQPYIWKHSASDYFCRLIIPKPKPDPLEEVIKEWWNDAETLRELLEARGLEIRKKGETK